MYSYHTDIHHRHTISHLLLFTMCQLPLPYSSVEMHYHRIFFQVVIILSTPLRWELHSSGYCTGTNVTMLHLLPPQSPSPRIHYDYDHSSTDYNHWHITNSPLEIHWISPVYLLCHSHGYNVQWPEHPLRLCKGLFFVIDSDDTKY